MAIGNLNALKSDTSPPKWTKVFGQITKSEVVEDARRFTIEVIANDMVVGSNIIVPNEDLERWAGLYKATLDEMVYKIDESIREGTPE